MQPRDGSWRRNKGKKKFKGSGGPAEDWNTVSNTIENSKRQNDWGGSKGAPLTGKIGETASG